MHREQCLGQIQIRDGSTSSLAIRKGSPCQQDDDSLDSRRRGCSGTALPEVINTAMASAPVKFLHLKHLTISIYGAYDYFSLVSFLDATPCLETFVLNVLIEPECISELLSEGPSHLRQMSGYRHDKLQSVKISRFYSSKSLVELTSYILENSASLESLTLDTTDGVLRCSNGRHAKCFCLGSPMEAHRAVLVIGKYIEGKVPSTVKLNVVKPCSRCHAV